MTHINLPPGLQVALREHEYAHYIGVSPAGVEYVAYRPENVKPLKHRLRCQILKFAIKGLPHRNRKLRRFNPPYFLFQVTRRT